MEFQHPEWILLFPALMLMGYVVKRLDIFRPLRVCVLAVLTLLFMRPSVDKYEDALDLWVLFDVSESTEELVTAHSEEWTDLLDSSKPNNGSRLQVMHYAGDALVKEAGSETEVYRGSKKLTRTRLALEHVAALASEERPSRVLLFTDGYSTEPLGDVVRKMNAQGIPLDYRLVREDMTDDFRVARIELPERVQVREPFVMGVTVRGFEDGLVPLRIYQNGKMISKPGAQVRVLNGVGKAEFSTRLQQSGAYEFAAEIVPETDTHRGNNKAVKWVEVAGGPRVLLASKYTGDPVAKALREQGLEVKQVFTPLDLKVGQLSGARAVVFNNIAAHEVPADFLDALDFFVREQGGGFMMVGGKHSFGSGGYFQSSIDSLLPISMELKEDQRKLAVAMAVVLDRSGSMGAPAGKGTKMDLANSGTENAIKLLGAQDSVAVYAVDSGTHTVVKQQGILGNKDKMIKRVRRIKSQGGGIYVYTGLKDAWSELKKVPIATKHMILFADAADAEEPGGYKKLIEQMNQKGATISVIGLGSRSDTDAKFLEDIAKRGKGRVFFTNKPMDIPKLFAQETVTLARSAFVEEVTGAQATGHWSDVSPKPMGWLAKVGGYNLSYAREDATVSLISRDEYKAPLIAHARRGIGRTAAVSFPLGGEFSEEVRAWEQYGDFVQTISRWLMGSELPPGIGVRHRIVGTRLSVDLMYDPEIWAESFGLRAPEVRLFEELGDTAGVSALAWKRIAPGHFSMSYDLEEGSVVRGAIRVGDQAIPFGPLAVGTSAEWAFDPERVHELREVSAQTDGREVIDLSDAWLRPQLEKQADLRIPLAVLALVLMVLDALVTRVGWSFHAVPWRKFSFSFKSGERKRRREVYVASEAVAEPETSEPVQEEGVPRAQADAGQRRARYSRAKK
ncbi:VWA domain-containing protein [Rubritalea tangerina]|uniref:VWA domain-containing protein n=1 Tax=Rubritalea tangerina TaxID=430798 RepID=A0ABW4ZAB8_9BACT